jgi:DNA-binding transcriptional MerR regulator
LSHAGEIRRDFPNYLRRLLMLSIRDVAKTTGVPVHKIRYALASGQLSEPGRAGGRRCFLAEDIEAVRRLFQSKKK